jgi:hypothetical protein
METQETHLTSIPLLAQDSACIQLWLAIVVYLHISYSAPSAMSAIAHQPFPQTAPSRDTKSASSSHTELGSLHPIAPSPDEQQAMLQVRTDAVGVHSYSCIFWFLPCEITLNHQEEWTSHCKSHFGSIEPPQSARCQFCPWPNSESRDWFAVMEHMACTHDVVVADMKNSRLPSQWYLYLWQKRLIIDQVYKDLLAGTCDPNKPQSNFSQTNDRRRDRRDPAKAFSKESMK